ncbi:unnamed protein product, partial [marine sediment metagenome]
MILLQVDILRMIADFIGVIFLYSKVVLTPIGEVMKLWIESVLNFIDTFIPMRYEIYIIIFIILVVSGVIINYHWPGEKKEVKEEEKKEMDVSAKKCKYCGKS